MARLHLESRMRCSLGGVGALILALAASSAWAEPFDISDATTREIIVDIEASADPETIGTSVGAVFPGGVADQIAGTWTSDGTTGTITFTLEALEALYNANVMAFTLVPGTAMSDFTIDIATGHGAWTTSAGYDFDGIPPAVDTLALGFSSSGGPYLPLGLAGTAAGYEEDSLAPGAFIFCTDVFTALGAPGGCGDLSDGGNMTFNPSGFAIVPAYAYMPGTGLLNMTGNTFASVSSAPEWSERGDVMLSEVVTVPALGPGAMVLLAISLVVLTAGVLRLRGAGAASAN